MRVDMDGGAHGERGGQRREAACGAAVCSWVRVGEGLQVQNHPPRVPPSPFFQERLRSSLPAHILFLHRKFGKFIQIKLIFYNSPLLPALSPRVLTAVAWWLALWDHENRSMFYMLTFL